MILDSWKSPLFLIEYKNFLFITEGRLKMHIVLSPENHCRQLLEDGGGGRLRVTPSGGL